jgi:thiamine pyrophosphokinase
MMKALLFCGGPFPHKESMRAYVEGFDLVIAVDSGYKHALALGVSPHVLLGDFDSLDPVDLEVARGKGVLIKTYSKHKDLTDTHIALLYALEEGCREIRLLGALGHRMDHTLSNMSLLKWLYDQGAKGELVDAYNEIFYMEDSMVISNRKGQTLSVVPISDLVGLTIEGVKYPLDNRLVPFSSSLCISNEITGNLARINIKQGQAYVMLTQDIL